MAIVLNAGETFNVSCPNGDRPILKIGEKIPDEKNTLVKVLKIKNEVVTLGPFKTGNLTFSLPCSSSNIPIEATVKELNPEAASQHYSSLNPEKVDYPLSFFILIIFLILSALGSFLYLKNKRKNKLIPSEKKTPVKDPRLELEKYLLHCETNIKNPENKHFHESYTLLRKFLEKENKLNTRSLTTGEFLGTFRALALQQSTNQKLLSQLEYVLKTSDDVRFAGRVVSSQMWQDYLSKTKAIFLAFPKKEESNKAKENGKKG
jgi:hypothetical protein